MADKYPDPGLIVFGNNLLLGIALELDPFAPHLSQGGGGQGGGSG